MLKNNPRSERPDTIFASILADGMFHVAVAEGTENAILREYDTEDDKKANKNVAPKRALT